MSICPEPGCGKLHPGKGRCPEHLRTQQQRDWARRVARGTRQVYDSVRWKTTRRQCFHRDGWRCRAHDHTTGGRCAHADPTGRTLHAHHHPHSAADLLQQGLDPFDPNTVITLCHSHHSTHEAALRKPPTPAVATLGRGADIVPLEASDR